MNSILQEDVAQYLKIAWGALLIPVWLRKDIVGIGPAIRDGTPLSEVDDDLWKKIFPKLSQTSTEVARQCLARDLGEPRPASPADVAHYMKSLWASLLAPKWTDDELEDLGKAIFAHVSLDRLDERVFYRLLPKLSQVASELGSRSRAYCESLKPRAAATGPSPTDGSAPSTSPGTPPALASAPPAETAGGEEPANTTSAGAEAETSTGAATQSKE